MPKPPDEFAVQLDTAIRLNEPLPDVFELVYTEYVTKTDPWANGGYWMAWVLDKRTNLFVVCKVYEKGERFGPSYRWKWVTGRDEFRCRLVAFRTAEALVTDLRKAAQFAWLLWPHDVKPLPFNPKAYAEGKHPVGNLVKFPKTAQDLSPLTNLKRPPGLYRVILKPYRRGSVVGVGAAYDENEPCLSMIRVAEHPDIPVKGANAPGYAPGSVVVSSIYANVAVADVEVVPNYEAALRRLVGLADRDPEFYRGCVRTAEDGFTSFGYDMLAEYWVDRGDVGDWFRGRYQHLAPRDFPGPANVPTQYFADALHAIGTGAGANGTVKMSEEVRKENSLDAQDIRYSDTW